MSTNSTQGELAGKVAFIVRHGTMRFLGEYEAPAGFVPGRLTRVLIRSERGLEIGEVLCRSTAKAKEAIAEPTFGVIIRQMTEDDEARARDILTTQKKEIEIARKIVDNHHLAMQVIDIEHLFGGERLVFYFLSEKRIDFRELVKSLAREFQTRIELRQVGIRDEAKLLADYGDCGKPVCCNTHMVVMPPVSMRMAKIQKTTLDPAKISGRCGRLKCCLRFEQDVYDEIQAELPAVGSRVVTNKGQGKVLAQEILARRLLVEFEDGRRLPISAQEILTRL